MGHHTTMVLLPMNIHAITAYHAVQHAARALDLRQAEADLLRRYATEIETANSPVALTRALEKQRDLWTTFAVNLCTETNPLPKDLRLNLLRIAYWILSDLHSQTPSLQQHIDLNRQIAAGLQRNNGDHGTLPV